MLERLLVAFYAEKAFTGIKGQKKRNWNSKRTCDTYSQKKLMHCVCSQCMWKEANPAKCQSSVLPEETIQKQGQEILSAGNVWDSILILTSPLPSKRLSCQVEPAAVRCSTLHIDSTYFLCRATQKIVLWQSIENGFRIRYKKNSSRNATRIRSGKNILESMPSHCRRAPDHQSRQRSISIA